MQALADEGIDPESMTDEAREALAMVEAAASQRPDCSALLIR